MRLVKKTVNQDDVSAYHLFYADGLATPGTDITFFDWPVARERRGTHSIVAHGAARRRGERPRLVARAPRRARREARRDGRARRAADARLRGSRGAAPQPGRRWRRPAMRIPGRRARCLPSARSAASGRSRSACRIWRPTDAVLTAVMNMRPVRTYPHPENRSHIVHVYEMGEGGPAAEIHVAVQPELAAARQGGGGVHHVAFRTPDARIRRLGRAAATDCASRTAARSTATISAASISASRTASCSRSPATAPASPPTSRSNCSARSWRCRRSWSRAARRSRQG